MLLLPGSQGVAGAGVGEIPDGHRWDAPPKRTPPPGADAIDGATVLGIIGRQISKLAERAKKAPPDDRGCGRQISSSRPAFVHVKGAPRCGNRSPELGASPRRTSSNSTKHMCSMARSSLKQIRRKRCFDPRWARASHQRSGASELLRKRAHTRRSSAMVGVSTT
jgi:hypothetical protein